MKIIDTYIVYHPAMEEFVKIYHTINRNGDITKLYIETKKDTIFPISHDEASKLLEDY